MTHKRKQRLYFRCNNYSNKAQLRAEASGPYRKTENVDSDNEASGGGRGAWTISARLTMRATTLFKQHPVLRTNEGKVRLFADISLRGTLLTLNTPFQLGYNQLTACTKCV